MAYLTPPGFIPGTPHNWICVPVPADGDWLAIVVGQLYALADDWIWEEVGASVDDTLDTAEEIHHNLIILDSQNQGFSVNGSNATMVVMSTVNGGPAIVAPVWTMDNGNA